MKAIGWRALSFTRLWDFNIIVTPTRSFKAINADPARPVEKELVQEDLNGVSQVSDTTTARIGGRSVGIRDRCPRRAAYLP